MDKLSNFRHFPDRLDSYKVSFIPSVVDKALELYYFFESNLLLEKSHYRLNVNLTYDPVKLEIKNSNTYIPKYLHTRMTDVVNTILFDGYHKFGDVYIRIEKLYPNKLVQELDKRRTRFKELIPTLENRTIDSQYSHPSLLWHFDSKGPRGCIPFILYLSDVSETGGGTCISDPPIRAIEKLDNSDKVGISQENISVDDIKYKNITGPAGTLVSFNSYTLHRGGIPFDKPRIAMILNFYPKENLTIYR